MRIVFMGTPDFAVPCLRQLIDDKYDVCGVFTQPDKPKGRGYVMTPPPVKVLALENDIPVFQPTKMRDGTALSILKELKPEIIVVAAYGRILPKEILDFPKYGCINIHGSLLPKYRGAAPIQWAVLNGENKTGVTLMQMDVGLDTGDILYSEETDIGENETAGELFDRLALLGAHVLSVGLPKLINGELTPIKQDDSLSCYSPMLDKSICNIDWNENAQSIHNKVRGLSPWPVAVCTMGDKKVKIHSSRVIKADEADTLFADDFSKELLPGQIAYSQTRLIIKCGQDSFLEIIELQLEGKKRMSAKDFLVGHKLQVGSNL